MNPPQPNPRRQAALFSFLRWAALLVILFVLMLLGYYLYVNFIDRAPAEVAPVERGPAVSTVYGTFTVNATNALSLFAQNAGYLRSDQALYSTYSSLGTTVKQDQLMATVEDQNVTRAVKQAQSDFDAAVARQKNGPGSAGALKSAQASVDAYSRLAKGSVPQVQRDAAQNDLNHLKMAVDNENLELQHGVDATTSLLRTAQDQLKRTEIRAPFDGVLTAIGFNNNAYVLPNQLLFTVSSADTYVSGLVNEEDVGALKTGMKAELHFYSDVTKNYLATLDAILPTPEGNSSRYYVTLHVDEKPDSPFLYGLTGDMVITKGRKENALTIPARAVNTDQVLIVEDGVVEQRTVTVGFKGADAAEIASGLTEGQMVIVEDQDAFHAGQRVRPVKVKSTRAKK